MPTMLSDLRLRARRRADMEYGKFVSDAELTVYVNDSYGELYDLLVSRFQDYFVKDPLPFTLSGSTSGNNFTAVPSDFYKLLGVDRDVGGGEWLELGQFNFNERNRQNNGIRGLAYGIYHSLRYRLLGAKLTVTSADIADGNYRVWYIPTRSQLVNDTDQIDPECDRWVEFIEVSSAIKCKAKQDDDVSTLGALKAGLEKRITEMAANRNAGSPERVTDVRGGLLSGYGPGYGRY